MNSAGLNRFKDRAVIVTGGASGIGAACCRRFATEGARVGVLDRNLDLAHEVASSIVDAGGEAYAAQVDVKDRSMIEKAIRNTAKQLGCLDAAVNSAGIGGDHSALADAAPEFWDETIAINLSGVYHSMRAEFAEMSNSRRGGAIVNIASILGVVGFADAAPYIAAKHGVIGLTRCAAISWGAQNIRVTAICPTFMRTPLNDNIPDELWLQLIDQHPVKRLPSTDEVAAMAAYLASEEASTVTGSAHLIDSGYTAG